MPSCVFKQCKNSSNKKINEDGLSFHRFPTDPVSREVWAKIIRENRQDKDWIPSKFCVICSLHFRTEDFHMSKTGRRIINKTSKPLLDLSTLSSCLEISDENIAEEPENQNIKKDSLNQNFTVDLGFDDSDLDSVFDSPKKSRLRKELRKQQMLTVKHKLKLKRLQERVRRLKKRNCSLKNVLNDLKEKNFIDYDTHNVLADNAAASELFRNINKTGKKRKYTPAMRKFCLTLNYYSPKSYEYVRKTFNSALPHPKTLTKWYSHIKTEPGFTQESYIVILNN